MTASIAWTPRFAPTRVNRGLSWLQFLADVGRSPNTVRDYGRRVAWYLSCCALTMDWREATMSHLALWRRIVAASPVSKTNGRSGFRSESTVGLWMVAVRSFYEWADAHSLLTTDVVSRMTELKYFAPGVAGGGEHGCGAPWAGRGAAQSASRLRRRAGSATPERGIDSPSRCCRHGIGLIDLLTTSGIRVGEALSLFVADLHFGGGSQQLGCGHADPHVHVRVDNPVEDSARAKGARGYCSCIATSSRAMSITRWSAASSLSSPGFATPARTCSSTFTPRSDGLAWP
jgi:hypothetical protein